MLISSFADLPAFNIQYSMTYPAPHVGVSVISYFFYINVLRGLVSGIAYGISPVYLLDVLLLLQGNCGTPFRIADAYRVEWRECSMV